MKVVEVTFSGGEPLLVPQLFDVAERLVRAGVKVVLYTSGWGMTEERAGAAKALFDRVHVSMDGASPDRHDAIRGRRGSFDVAMTAVRLLAAASGSAAVGVDVVVLRSNFSLLREMATVFASSGPIQFVSFGGVVPAGLATREGFASAELLSDEQLNALDDRGFGAAIADGMSQRLEVTTTSNRELMFGNACWFLEPDGGVRAMPTYEGLVGNILVDEPSLLWSRCEERRRDPFVVGLLGGVKSSLDWAAAARAIDLRFGDEGARKRIAQRSPYVGGAGP